MENPLEYASSPDVYQAERDKWTSPRRSTSGEALILLVIPAKAGIQVVVANLKMDSGLRRNDEKVRLIGVS